MCYPWAVWGANLLRVTLVLSTVARLLLGLASLLKFGEPFPKKVSFTPCRAVLVDLQR